MKRARDKRHAAAKRLPGAVALEPFAALAYVRVKSDSFLERGGLPALHGGGGSVDATFSTLGVRASTHAFAGSIPFTISGVPLAKIVAVLEARWKRSCAPTSSREQPIRGSSVAG